MRLHITNLLLLFILASKFSEEQEPQEQSVNLSHLTHQWLQLDSNLHLQIPRALRACTFFYVCLKALISWLCLFYQDSQVRPSTTYSLHQPRGNKEHGTERSGYLYKKSDGWEFEIAFKSSEIIRITVGERNTNILYTSGEEKLLWWRSQLSLFFFFRVIYLIFSFPLLFSRT